MFKNPEGLYSEIKEAFEKASFYLKDLQELIIILTYIKVSA